MADTIKGSYKNISAWKKSFKLSLAIYRLTKNFPLDERFGLTSQLRRAAISIPSNIAEGYARGSRQQFHHFLRIAYASGAELETQLLIAKHIDETKKYDYVEVDRLLKEVMKILNTMIYSQKNKNDSS